MAGKRSEDPDNSISKQGHAPKASRSSPVSHVQHAPPVPHIPHTPDEIIAVVDENDNIIGEATRDNAHLEGLLHREVFCYLVNAKKQLLLQKRSDIHKWDHSVGGHFPKDQSYEEAAKREFEEELGYRLPQSAFKELGKEKITYTSHSGLNIRFVKLFIVQQDLPINVLNPDPGEVEEVKYFSKSELDELFTHPELITTNLKFLVGKYVAQYLR
jgi:isopentenyldiphosphate isomerase